MPRIFLVLLLAFATFTARDDDKKPDLKPSPAIKKILDKAVLEVKKNCQAFDKANAKPLGDARTALEELSKQQTSDGKTKDAIATLQQAETLERDVMAMVSGGKPKLSPAVKPILDQAVLGVMANRQALQKANETPLSDARSALEELAKKQTKDGKTKDAIATLQQVESLERDVIAMAKAPAVVAKVANPAQKGAVAWNGHKYKYFAEGLTWPDAKRKCEEMGGYLVIIDNMEEQAFVAQSLSTVPAPPNELWLGIIRRPADGRWVSVQGKELRFQDWWPNEPNGDGPCGQMWRKEQWHWNDHPGDRAMPFICEWDE